MNRTYQDVHLEVNADITLSGVASHHLLKVLRLRVGEQLVLFNGLGGEYVAELTDVSRKVATCRVLNFINVNREAGISVHLGQGLSRGDRMDYVIQKSVEMGVAEISPLFTERCQVKLDPARLEKRMSHWYGILISAAEQSGRTALPVLHKPITLKDWLSQCNGFGLVCDFNQSNFAASEFQDHVSLLIGPESGFTNEELELAYQANFKSLSLGPRTLRTETAPIAALSTLWCLAPKS